MNQRTVRSDSVRVREKMSTEQPTRVMISAKTNPETRVRVDADLGYGFRALPPFEQERRIERVLEDAREKLLSAVGA